MAYKLFPLRYVPEDEAEEIRALMREHEIDTHETSAGLLGIGEPAIWVNDSVQFIEAQSLIEQYQIERYTLARQAYREQNSSNLQENMIDRFKQQPVKISAAIIVALGLLVLSTAPFWT